jgi:hypothetical protein
MKTIDTYKAPQSSRSQERAKRLNRTLGVVTLGALLVVGGVKWAGLVAEHDANIDKLAQKELGNVTEVVVASDKTIKHKAVAGETVSSVVIDFSDITTANPDLVSLDAAVVNATKYVENMPENAEVLKDNTLQIGERLVVPKWVATSVEPDSTLG